MSWNRNNIDRSGPRGRSASWFLLPLVRTNDGTRAFRSGVLIFVFSFENLFIFHVRTE